MKYIRDFVHAVTPEEYDEARKNPKEHKGIFTTSQGKMHFVLNTMEGRIDEYPTYYKDNAKAIKEKLMARYSTNRKVLDG